MRLLILQPWISYRGAETVSVLQTYYVQKLGHEVSLACCFRTRTLPPHAMEIPYLLPHPWIQNVLSKSKPLFYLFSIPVMLALLVKHRSRYETIIAHNYPSLWVGAIMSKFSSKKLIWYVHGVPPQSGFPRNIVTDVLWKVLFNHIDTWSATSCDEVIVVSRKIQKEVEKRYGITSKVLYPPVDVELFNTKFRGNTLRRKLKIPSNASVMMQVSSATKEKRADITLNCFSDLRSKGMDVYLIFIGANPKSALFEEIIPVSLKKNIRVIRYVPASKLREYYQLSDVVCAPSKITEGCSVVPLQALLSGTESVVVRGSGVDEILNDLNNGEVSTGTLKDFSEKVKLVIKRSGKDKPSIQKGSKSVRELKLLVDPETHARKLISYAQNV